MSTTSESDSWFEQRLEAIHERFVRGEIDEVLYQGALEDLWRAFDNFVECADTATPAEAMYNSVDRRHVTDGRADGRAA